MDKKYNKKIFIKFCKNKYIEAYEETKKKLLEENEKYKILEMEEIKKIHNDTEEELKNINNEINEKNEKIYILEEEKKILLEKITTLNYNKNIFTFEPEIYDTNIKIINETFKESNIKKLNKHINPIKFKF